MWDEGLIGIITLSVSDIFIESNKDRCCVNGVNGFRETIRGSMN